jgi:hypothetical protein
VKTKNKNKNNHNNNNNKTKNNHNNNDIKFDNDTSSMTKNNFGENNNNTVFENMKIVSLVIHLPTDHLRKVKTRFFVQISVFIDYLILLSFSSAY